jgi:5-methylcytosine-specific restriction endonuclease McrA
MRKKYLKHQDSRYVLVRKKVKPRLLKQLPLPCPRCGRIMERGMRLDLGHISRAPALAFEPTNLRLEHMACNRRAGQAVSAKRRTPKDVGERLPGW